MEPSSLLDIFARVVLPVLLLAGLGTLLNRQKRLQLETLNRISMYALVPSFLFVKVYESTLSWEGIGQVAYGVFVPVLLLGIPLYAILRRVRAPGNTCAALLVGGLVSNAGNFGLPVTQFFYANRGAIFPGMTSAEDGEAVQALIIMISNLSVWLLGYGVIAWAGGGGVRGMLGFFRLPMIYVLFAAFALRESDTQLPTSVLTPLRMLAGATVPVMLITLGAQLAKSAHWPSWKLIGPAVVIKLLVLPAVTAAFVWACGLWPWPGAQIIIASAAPTAINTLLLSLELDGDAQTAADCVFWTTLVAAITITGVLVTVEYFGAV